MTKKLTHVGPDGTPRMVDVSDKTVTAREAIARGRIVMSRAAAKVASSGSGKKGDPIQVARLAGIMAAKRTAELIPLCHPLRLTGIDVRFTLDPAAAQAHGDFGSAPGAFAKDGAGE